MKNYSTVTTTNTAHLSLLVSIAFLLLFTFAPVAADGVKSFKNLDELNDYLKGEPFVNRGIDGVLSHLPQEKSTLVNSGKTIYRKHCAVCHGDNLQGQANWNTRLASGLLPAPPHDDTGHTWHHADDQLFEIVKYGASVAMEDPDYRSAMPAFADVLGDDDILAVLVYIRSTWSTQNRQWQAGINDSQSGR